jgi:hypothetical protein
VVLAFGLGLLNNYSVIFLGVGLGLGILLSPLRQELMSRKGLIGALTVLAILLPHLIWQTWRPLGIAFVVVGIWLTVQNAKPYYLAPAFPMIMAAGAVLLEHWLSRRQKVFVAGVYQSLPAADKEHCLIVTGN